MREKGGREGRERGKVEEREVQKKTQEIHQIKVVFYILWLKILQGYRL